jgi:hypothetical protein
MDPRDFFDQMKHDPNNPDPWLALYLDQSVPMDGKAKAAFLKGQRSATRRVLMPLIRPLARLSIFGIKILRTFVPERIQSSWLLHRSIYWGLKTFVTPEANYLILRHFNIGTEILRFIADNAGIEIETTRPLRPKKLEDLIDDTFTIHDLNIYNFIIELNDKLRSQGREMTPPEQVDFSAITSADVPIEELPNTWLNFVDLQTAIEIYTPLYALFLSDKGFWRASNSLQLDETVALYVGKILDSQLQPNVVHNKHPMVPRSTTGAGFRLTLHGLDAESLHGHLRMLKAQTRKAAVAVQGNAQEDSRAAAAAWYDRPAAARPSPSTDAA